MTPDDPVAAPADPVMTPGLVWAGERELLKLVDLLILVGVECAPLIPEEDGEE